MIRNYTLFIKPLKLLAPLLVMLGAVGPAQGLDLSRLDIKSSYEEELIHWALKETLLEREPSPAGKIIERIEIVREEIISQSDPWPNLINIFHSKTKDYVVRQELLVRPGMAWDEALIKESIRNLRKLFILAVVRFVPCKSKDPGKVVLMVVTKDLWSIRVDSAFSMVGDTLQDFEVNPSEHNVLGHNKLLGLHVRLQQLHLGSGQVLDKFQVGQRYVDERLLGSRLYLHQYLRFIIAGDVPCGGVIKSAGTEQKDVWCPESSLGDLEGVRAYLSLERPLFSLATKLGFRVYGYADIRQIRVFSQPGPVLKTVSLQYTPPATGNPITAEVPWVYDKQDLRGRAMIIHSHGKSIKHDLQAGAGVYRYLYSAPESFPFPAAVLQQYQQRYLPRSEDVTYFFIGYHTRDTRYIRLKNIRSFAFSEDYLLGHNATLELRFATDLNHQDQGFMEALLDAHYRWKLGHDLLLVTLAARSRWQPQFEDPTREGPWINTRLEASVTNVSPLLWIGRLHLRVKAVLRHNDLQSDRFSYLGGDTGLRGFASRQFSGDNLFLVNAEFRSLPINLLSLHLGFVLFYDGGAVFGGPDPADPIQQLPFRYYQSVGVGIRGIFPQFDKESLRVDFGIPLSSGAVFSGTWFSLSFSQVF